MFGDTEYLISFVLHSCNIGLRNLNVYIFSITFRKFRLSSLVCLKVHSQDQAGANSGIFVPRSKFPSYKVRV